MTEMEMNMQVKELTVGEAKEIYETYARVDFPPEEIKPFAMIKKMWKSGLYRAYGFYGRAAEKRNQTGEGECAACAVQNCNDGCADGDKHGELCAYAFVLANNKERVLLLDYFAVLGQKRGLGIGSMALSLLQKACADWDVLVIEVEDDELGTIDEGMRITRRRRISFYSNAGCVMTLTRSRVFGVDYRIMVMPLSKEKIGEHVADWVTSLYGGLYNSEMMKKHFAITAE